MIMFSFLDFAPIKSVGFRVPVIIITAKLHDIKHIFASLREISFDCKLSGRRSFWSSERPLSSVHFGLRAAL